MLPRCRAAENIDHRDRRCGRQCHSRLPRGGQCDVRPKRVRQSLVRHQLGRRRRARRLLPGAGRRHLPQARPRRDDRPGRSAGEQPAPACGRPARLLHEHEHAAVVRCGGAEHPDARGGGDVPEGPAGDDRPPRSRHRQFARPQGADAVHLAGRRHHLLPVAQARVRSLRFAGASRTPSIRSRSSSMRTAPCRAT